MPSPPYVELGAQSAFSFLRAASLPEDLASQAASQEHPSVALTDIGGLYGLPRFHAAMKNRDLTALVGARLELRGDPPSTARRHPNTDAVSGDTQDPASHGELRLLCQSRRGYQNLCRLLTLGHSRHGKNDCIVTPADLAAHAEDLFALWLPPTRPTPTSADILKRIFLKDTLYLEVHHHLDRRETRRRAALVDFAAAQKLPLVGTNDVRLARPAGRPLLDVLTCMRHKTNLDHIGRRLLPSNEWSLKPARTMAALFADLPQAVHNTRRIAERCEFTLEKLGYRFPDFPTPPGESQDALLRRLTYDGARGRYGSPLPDKARRQLDKELKLIAELRLPGYFLIVWDIVRFAKSQGILAQGRGSAANSAVCYCLGITAIDAVNMEMLFERFLSAERGEWPDIDIDLPSGDERERVIQYVYKTYGPRGAAMTANVITYRDKLALREVGKALGFSPAHLDQASKLSGRWASAHDMSDEAVLRERMLGTGVDPDSPRVRLWAKLAQELVGLPRHLGQHSGGMVIAQGHLDEVCPIEPASMPGRSVVQWDKDDCAQLGIIKVDLLGLGMLAALEEALPLIERVEGKRIDLGKLPPDDPAVYDMLCRADTVGVFQIESRAQMATLPRLRPRNFYDLVIEIALIRPGPITGQMVHPYLNRRKGTEAVTYPHPSLEPILKRTLGVPIFQEQVMRVAMVASGFTGGEAEELRRAMGFKRKSERMQDLETRLRRGMDARGIRGEAQETIIRNITAFASYGFPESHSASFALIAYASAYLKHYHPAAFLCALLNAYPMGFYHPSTLLKDAQRHGVRVLPIDIARSLWSCDLEDGNTVRLGLRYVDGLSQEQAESVIAARAVAPFVSLKDLGRRTTLDSGALDTLAEVGALASLGKHRREALWQVSRLRERSFGLLGLIEESGLGDESSHGPSIALGPAEIRDEVSPLASREEKALRAGQDSSPLAKHTLSGSRPISLALVPDFSPPASSRTRPARERGTSFESSLPAMSLRERIWADYRGSAMSVGSHPMVFFRKALTQRGIVDGRTLASLRDRTLAKTAGLVITRQRPGGGQVFFITLEDETGFVNVIVLNDIFEAFRPLAVGSGALYAEGVVQNREGVVHLKARVLRDLDEVLAAPVEAPHTLRWEGPPGGCGR